MQKSISSARHKLLIKASILGGLSVLFGAFGAHALKSILTPEQLISFEKGVRYQMYHAIMLGLLFLIHAKFTHLFFVKAANFMFYGVLLFSASIYLLTLKNIIGIEALKYVAPLTPIGGTLIIVGWVLMLLGALKIKQ